MIASHPRRFVSLESRLAAALLGLATLPVTAPVAAEPFAFVVPGDDAAQTVTDRSGLLEPIGPSSDFVQVRDGHFFAGDRRVRFWGVNLCFAANFPTHEEADAVAPHLAKLGVNAVRFHHMDMQDAPNGIWGGFGPDGKRRLDPEMLDRLDYFLAKLHEQGIYADINLLVSRTLTPEEGFPVFEGGPWWSTFNKWVVYYDPGVQAELKRYCRELLTHRNPYRGNRARVDDPGIALVEMLNENYFSVQGYGIYPQLPERFQKSFAAAWNEWLRGRYGEDAALRKAWQAGQTGLGETLADSSAWTEQRLGEVWRINATEDALPRNFTAAELPGSSTPKALRLVPQQAAEQDHALQLSAGDLSVQKDQPLTLSFFYRSPEPRKFRVELSTEAGGPWRPLGLNETLEAGPDWRRFERVILPGESVLGGGQFAFSFRDSAVPLEFAMVSLRRGAEAKELPAEQSLAAENIAVPTADSPVAAHRDLKRFMIETELAWVRELKRYLTDELGVKVPITASQVDYHTPEVNAQLVDFVDMHNYWHHPIFPSGQDWSAEAWTVGNDPMEAHPAATAWPTSSLLMRMPQRYAGKPMTLSEWSYPEPSPYAAGCVPMAATLLALQDWDGVFFFQYDGFARGGSGGANPYFRDFAADFFSFNGQPVKLALLSQFANVYLRGDLRPLDRSATGPVSSPPDGRLALQRRVGVSPNVQGAGDALSPPDETDLSTPGGAVRWISDGEEGHLILDTPATKAVWGTIASGEFELGRMKFSVGAIEPNYGFVVLSSADDRPVEESDRMVLTVASHSQNQEMRWNEDRTSVGTQWGSGPTLVAGFETRIVLPQQMVGYKLYSLDGTGRRRAEVPIDREGDAAAFVVGPQHETLWYELSRE